MSFLQKIITGNLKAERILKTRKTLLRLKRMEQKAEEELQFPETLRLQEEALMLKYIRSH